MTTYWLEFDDLYQLYCPSLEAAKERQQILYREGFHTKLIIKEDDTNGKIS